MICSSVKKNGKNIIYMTLSHWTKSRPKYRLYFLLMPIEKKVFKLICSIWGKVTRQKVKFKTKLQNHLGIRGLWK